MYKEIVKRNLQPIILTYSIVVTDIIPVFIHKFRIVHHEFGRLTDDKITQPEA
jgi:hypothetical protein